MSSTLTEETPLQAAPEQNETTAGNYFISNYPPFSFWKPEFNDNLLSALESPPADDRSLGIYLHIPFCRKRCHFCYFKVYTDKDATAIKGYIQGALKELGLYADKPYFQGRKPSFVYFGGGTPSYLSANQLRRLTDGLKSYMPWDEVEEVTFECEPGTLSEGKLKALREMGVTRLSLGVENFNEHLLEVNGRAHRGQEIRRAYDYAREIGFPQINIDLIAGMLDETDENWMDTVGKAIELAPDSITIYQMEIPYNTTIYKDMKAQGKIVAPVADWETKRRWVSMAFDEMQKHGYTVASAYTAVKDQSNFLYRDRLWSGADLLALGVSSFGHVHGTHYQNQQDFEPYMNQINQGELPLFRSYTPSDEEKMVREFILQMKLGYVYCPYFKEKFGVDVHQRFASQLQTLKDWGFGGVEGDYIRLNREGLLQVDRLLHEFFLPEHRNARYT